MTTIFTPGEVVLYSVQPDGAGGWRDMLPTENTDHNGGDPPNLGVLTDTIALVAVGQVQGDDIFVIRALRRAGLTIEMGPPYVLEDPTNGGYFGYHHIERLSDTRGYLYLQLIVSGLNNDRFFHVVADVDPDTLVLDVALTEAAGSPATSASTQRVLNLTGHAALNEDTLIYLRGQADGTGSTAGILTVNGDRTVTVETPTDVATVGDYLLLMARITTDRVFAIDAQSDPTTYAVLERQGTAVAVISTGTLAYGADDFQLTLHQVAATAVVRRNVFAYDAGTSVWRSGIQETSIGTDGVPVDGTAFLTAFERSALSWREGDLVGSSYLGVAVRGTSSLYFVPTREVDTQVPGYVQHKVSLVTSTVPAVEVSTVLGAAFNQHNLDCRAWGSGFWLLSWCDYSSLDLYADNTYTTIAAGKSQGGYYAMVLSTGNLAAAVLGTRVRFR